MGAGPHIWKEGLIDRAFATLISIRSCLKQVDTFRKPETARRYVLLYDTKVDSSRLLVLKDDKLELAHIQTSNPEDVKRLAMAEVPVAAERKLLELAKQIWSDVLAPAKTKDEKGIRVEVDKGISPTMSSPGE